MKKREELLLKMYDQMFNDINRHIMVVWQCVGVLIGAFAIFALVEKKVVSLDIAASIVLLLCFWLMCHLLDAAYWYNRNLVIIANIERQFLQIDDLKKIHYYFGKHRPDNVMIEHLRIQFYLGVGLALIVMGYHFTERVVPGMDQPMTNFEPIRAIPYILVLIAIFYVWNLAKKLNDKYQEFMTNSPGIDVDTGATVYGVGHGHNRQP
ncbi:hypothetical protein V4V56_000599 [Vibrio mimicus]|uniref:hypothetical protein n=1 Tax=Vibrio mimicus TaxID=674 RepID=UPI0012ACADC9|nr:hypothetical protein [Vibrio mimicus]